MTRRRKTAKESGARQKKRQTNVFPFSSVNGGGSGARKNVIAHPRGPAIFGRNTSRTLASRTSRRDVKKASDTWSRFWYVPLPPPRHIPCRRHFFVLQPLVHSLATTPIYISDTPLSLVVSKIDVVGIGSIQGVATRVFPP